MGQSTPRTIEQPECENGKKNNRFNRKTLRLLKPKFVTLSVRNITMLIVSKTCKMRSWDPLEYHATVRSFYFRETMVSHLTLLSPIR